MPDPFSDNFKDPFDWSARPDPLPNTPVLPHQKRRKPIPAQKELFELQKRLRRVREAVKREDWESVDRYSLSAWNTLVKYLEDWSQ